MHKVVTYIVKDERSISGFSLSADRAAMGADGSELRRSPLWFTSGTGRIRYPISIHPDDIRSIAENEVLATVDCGRIVGLRPFGWESDIKFKRA